MFLDYLKGTFKKKPLISDENLQLPSQKIDVVQLSSFFKGFLMSRKKLFYGFFWAILITLNCYISASSSRKV
jgi:hypothetical protein